MLAVTTTTNPQNFTWGHYKVLELVKDSILGGKVQHFCWKYLPVREYSTIDCKNRLGDN